MAGNSNKRDLFLQVRGDIDPFTQAMKAGRSALAEFGGDVGKQLAAIEKAFQTQLGGSGVEKSAREMQSAYTKSFVAVRQQAEEALSRPLTGAGALSLNVPQAREAAAAAQNQARALREVADAAGRVAVATGNAKGGEAAYAAAAAAAANAAELRNREIVEQLGLLERLQGELDASGVSQARFNNGQRALTVQNGAQRAGLQQLSYQIGDVATQFSSGTPVLQIFAQQSSQVVQAIGLMSAESKGFAGFIGGPWGQLITAGIIVLTPFVAKLFEGAEAAKEAKLGSDGLADAQGVLGHMFDLTSGKLEHQNELLRLNARLTESNLRAEAAKEQKSANDTFNGVGGVSAALSFGPSRVTVPTVRRLVARITSGALTSDAAVGEIDKLDKKGLFSGSGISAFDLKQALADRESSTLKVETADLIADSLKSGQLAGGLKRDPPKPRKTPLDRTAQTAFTVDADFAGERRQLLSQLIGSQRKTAASDESRDQLQRDSIQADFEGRKRKFSDDLGAALADPKATAQAKAKARANEKELQLLNVRNRDQQLINVDIERQSAKVQDAAALDAQALQDKADQLGLQDRLADTAKDRLDIELKILALNEQLAKRAAQAVLDDPKSSDAARRLATGRIQAVDDQHDGNVEVIKRQNAGPLAEYGQRLHRATDHTNAALQGVAADGLGKLEDGLTGVISGTESVASAFKRMASSIVEDLARIAIEKLIVKAIGASFLGFSGGGMIEGFAGGGLLHGPGTGTSDSILAMVGGRKPIRVANGEFIINAASTKRHLPLIRAINDNRIPGFADGGLLGIDIGTLRTPHLSRTDVQSLSSTGASPARPIEIKVDARGSTNPAETEAICMRAFAAMAPSLIQISKSQTRFDLERPTLASSMG